MPATDTAKPRISKAALFDAAKTWDVKAVKAIIQAAPELVLATRPDNRMAIHVACSVKPGAFSLGEEHGIATVNALLDAGTPIDIPVPPDEDDFKATPLWHAASRGMNLPLVRSLLSRGADPSYCLWTVVNRDDATMLKELLSAKPQLNLRAHGETPMFYAARLGRLATLKLLIAAGADPTMTDKKGRNSVDIARERRLPKDIIDALAKLGAQKQINK